MADHTDTMTAPKQRKNPAAVAPGRFRKSATATVGHLAAAPATFSPVLGKSLRSPKQGSKIDSSEPGNHSSPPELASPALPNSGDAKDPATAAAEMPGPAAILALLPGMWDQHHAHDLAALRAARSKDHKAYKVAEIAKDRCWERIKAMQDLILTGQPASLADAAAVLLMAHSDIESWNDDGGSDRAHHAITSLLPQVIAAAGFVARAGGVDLGVIGKNYLTDAQAKILCGEVAA